MTRGLFTLLVSFMATSAIFGQQQKSTPDQGQDSTQSFVSPFGLGTGATLSVTSKGTSVAASVERQMISPAANFLQLGLSGTVDKNGQTQLYSSSDRDAPGFKGKVGMGQSTFIRKWAPYTETAGKFERQAMCRDILTVVNKTLKTPVSIRGDAECAEALRRVNDAFNNNPPTDKTVKDFDAFVLKQIDTYKDDLARPTVHDELSPAGLESAYTVGPRAQQALCDALKSDQAYKKAFDFCPSGAGVIKSPEDRKKDYPDLYRYILSGEPSKFQWKAWGSWAPTVTSVDYRAVKNGVPDLATKLQWTQLLSTGLGDIALYYGALAFGIEGGFGQTVKVNLQNVCNTITSGTHTSQDCDMAMIGKPSPKNSWTGSSALQFYPLRGLGQGGLINPGFQANFSYTAPTNGGHSSELSLPFYLAPSVSPIKFVFGVQPTWDWDTNPKVGNKFTIAIFVGARPEIVK
jgi:hypothetical protein